jgi:4'-phosphopantetheinyl transferase
VDRVLTLSWVDLEGPGVNELIAAHAAARDRADSQRFHVPRRQLQTLAGRALLRREIANLPADFGGPWQLEAGGQMQPRLVGAGGPGALAVSLAHSGRHVVAVIADAPAVGIDIEQIRPTRRWMAIAESVFSPGEQARCAGEGVSAFYRIWTLREALAKACGSGFRMVVDARERFADTPPDGAWPQVIDGTEWVFAARTLPDGFAVALALHQPDESPAQVAAILAALAA